MLNTNFPLERLRHVQLDKYILNRKRHKTIDISILSLKMRLALSNLAFIIFRLPHTTSEQTEVLQSKVNTKSIRSPREQLEGDIRYGSFRWELFFESPNVDVWWGVQWLKTWSFFFEFLSAGFFHPTEKEASGTFLWIYAKGCMKLAVSQTFCYSHIRTQFFAKRISYHP